MQKKMIRIFVMLLLVSISLATLPVHAEVPQEYQNSALERLVYMPNGSGPFQYYAQNDPVWQKAVYESPNSDTQRPFGDGGCNPTSLAMVVASLVPTERLNLLGMSAAEGRTFQLCSCSVNKFYCHVHRKDAEHTQVTLTSGEDFRAVLPLAIADFATGNNHQYETYRVRGKRSGGNGGTSQNLFAPIAAAYGLSFQSTREIDQVLATLDRGGMAIALCSGNSQIFSGSNGHYIVICSYDAEYLYIMDPYVRDVYKKDKKGIIENIDVGVKKVKRSNIARTGFGNYALFEPAVPTYYASLPVYINPYTGETDPNAETLVASVKD